MSDQKQTEATAVDVPASSSPPASKAETLASILRHEIVSGLCLPDDELPPEREVMKRFDVSRPTYREAMRILASEGLLKASRGARGGAVVLMPSIDPIARQAGAFLQMHGASLQDIFQARLLIEPEAARLVAQHCRESALSELAQCAAAQRFAVHDIRLFGTEETRFRQLLLEHSGSVTLKLLGTILSRVTDVHSRSVGDQLALTERHTKELQEGVRAKERLIEAMSSHDGSEAHRIWKAYIKTYFRRVVENSRVANLEVYSKANVPRL